MARFYLLVVAIGLAIGLMLPSGTPPPPDGPTSNTTEPGRPTLSVQPRPASAAPMVSSRGGSTVIRRGEDGHFYVDAQVNGMTVHFLVDTGASAVALSTDDAQRAGLQFNPAEFTVIGSGASGPVRGKPVTLERVAMNGTTVEQVSGAIIEGGEQSLLGQSFLARMGKIEITADEMVIR